VAPLDGTVVPLDGVGAVVAVDAVNPVDVVNPIDPVDPVDPVAPSGEALSAPWSSPKSTRYSMPYSALQ
jgi:hypothetical protein